MIVTCEDLCNITSLSRTTILKFLSRYECKIISEDKLSKYDVNREMWNELLDFVESKKYVKNATTESIRKIDVFLTMNKYRKTKKRINEIHDDIKHVCGENLLRTILCHYSFNKFRCNYAKNIFEVNTDFWLNMKKYVELRKLSSNVNRQIAVYDKIIKECNRLIKN